MKKPLDSGWNTYPSTRGNVLPMPTIIAVTRRFTAQALLDIADAEFAHQYGLGMWWAIYGDEQGKGLYDDRYLIDNISRNIQAGRYDSLSSPWFAHAGFYLGMLHGGMPEPRTYQLRPSETFVVLTDPDFTEGYQQGRQEKQHITASTLICTIHQWALVHLTGQALAYELGSLTGTLSRALIPATMLATLVQ